MSLKEKLETSQQKKQIINLLASLIVTVAKLGMKLISGLKRKQLTVLLNTQFIR